MAGNIERVRIDEVFGTLGHVQHLLEALGLGYARRYNTVAVNDILTPDGREVHTLQVAGQLDELYPFTRRANGFEMAKGFSDPVEGTTIFLQRFDMRATRDEDRVKHGRSHTFKVVVWLNTLATFVFAGGEDRLTLRPEGEGDCLRRYEGSLNTVVSDGVIAISDDDCNAARCNGWLLRLHESLRKGFRYVTVVWTARLGWSRGANSNSNGLSKLEVNIGKALDHTLIDDGIVAAIKLKTQSPDDVCLLRWRHRVVEELGLIEVLPELLSLDTLLDAYYLLGILEVAALRDLGRCHSFFAIGPVVDGASCDFVAKLSITLVIHYRADGAIDWQLLPVGTQSR